MLNNDNTNKKGAIVYFHFIDFVFFFQFVMVFSTPFDPPLPPSPSRSVYSLPLNHFTSLFCISPHHDISNFDCLFIHAVSVFLFSCFPYSVFYFSLSPQKSTLC